MFEPQIRYVRSADGTTIAYSDMGEGTPLLFSSNIWSHLSVGWRTEAREGSLQLVRDGFRLIRYDMRGMGMSERTVNDFSVEAQMADIEALRALLGLERFALFGSVHAALACMAYAAGRPDRLTHLILNVPFARGSDWYNALPTLRGLELLREMGDQQWELYTLTHATALLASVAGADPRAFAEQMRAATTPTTLRRYFDALKTHDVTPLLKDIRVPTLVLVSGGLGLGVQFAQTVAAAIPGAQLCVLPNTAGSPTAEAAAMTTRFILGREPLPMADAIGIDATQTGTAIILFADIVDSTAMTAQLGNTSFRARSTALETRVRAAVRAHGGEPVAGRTLGDGVLATFPSAAQGIAAALECADAGGDLGLALHLGLHAGDVLREDGNVHGIAVSLASRVSGLSGPNEVFVSQTVRDLARASTDVTFEDRGEHALKGIAEPQRVFAVRAQAAHG